MKTDNVFLKHALVKGMLFQDKRKLGIVTNTETFQVIGPNNVPHTNLFTLGSNLKGELWESTAVNEIRTQTEKLSDKLIQFLMQ